MDPHSRLIIAYSPHLLYALVVLEILLDACCSITLSFRPEAFRYELLELGSVTAGAIALIDNDRGGRTMPPTPWAAREAAP